MREGYHYWDRHGDPLTWQRWHALKRNHAYRTIYRQRLPGGGEVRAEWFGYGRDNYLSKYDVFVEDGFGATILHATAETPFDAGILVGDILRNARR